MKTPSTLLPERHRYHDTNNKRQRSSSSSTCPNIRKFLPFLFTSLATVTVSSLFLLCSPNPFKLTPKQSLSPSQQTHQNLHAVQDLDHSKTLLKTHNMVEKCDLFTGRWVSELRGSLLYSNSSCVTIPDSKNCFKNGRKDIDFLNWKWKPEKCDLPSFDAKRFLEMVRRKKMAFVGDSVARNHMESLLCLLSPEETPVDLFKDSKDRFRKWYFPRHDFTLVILWTKFLIQGNERMINGTGSSSFDLYLDKVDDSWSRSLPELDYVIISGGHWFFRVMYLHEGDKLTGCVQCHKPNVVEHHISIAIRMAFRAALAHINRCENCKTNLVTLVRTFAPGHFENGAWNTGGYCNRTSPLNEAKTDAFDWVMRHIQVEEVERARKDGEKQGKRFGVVDITRAMLMRPDGHPGADWGNKWMKGYNDCVHWCMPGPIDYWNDFLMEILRKESGLV